MRKHALVYGLLALMTIGIGGCTMGKPTYASVREEANTSLERIAAEVPDPKEIQRGPTQKPYSCENPHLVTGQSQGAFFTGQWKIFGPDDFDRESFISSLPELLGEGWETRDLGVEVAFAHVYLVDTESDVQVNVRAITIDGRPALDLTAISRCGVLSDGDRSGEPTTTSVTFPGQHDQQ